MFHSMRSLLFIFIFLSPLSAQSNISLKILHNKDITPFITDIAKLCNKVFYEYPYLCDGTVEEYSPYFQECANSQKSVAVLLFDDTELIGLAIGMPFKAMHESSPETAEPFTNHNVSAAYYLGDMVLDKQYRKKGYGRLLYTNFENTVKSMSTFDTMYLCKINESNDHPLKPDGYSTLEPMWRKFGFIEHREYTFLWDWKERDKAQKSPHKMIYWSKSLNKE